MGQQNTDAPAEAGAELDHSGLDHIAAGFADLNPAPPPEAIAEPAPDLGRAVGENLIRPVGEILEAVLPLTGGYLVREAVTIGQRVDAVAQKYGWNLDGIASGIPPELLLGVSLLPLVATVKVDLADIRKAQEAAEAAEREKREASNEAPAIAAA